jgi:hypothetical protein
MKKSNDELAAEFKAKLEEHEESERAKGKIFDPGRLLERASKIHSVDHPILGVVQFGELTFRDAFEIKVRVQKFYIHKAMNMHLWFNSPLVTAVSW